MADRRYRDSDVPSVLQGDMPDDGEQVCFRCRRYGLMDFHHLLGKTTSKSFKKFQEDEGLWIWLCRPCHRYIHDTAQGHQQWDKWKADSQKEFEKTHSREEWLKHAHKNYRD